MAISLNPNLRPNSLLQDTGIISQETCQRAVDIALPFLNLHAGTAQCLSLGMGAVKTWQLLGATATDLAAHEWKKSALSAMQCAAAILCLGATLVSPVGGIILSLSIRMGEHTWNLGLHLSNKEFKEFGKELIRAAGTAIYLGSMATGSATLIVLSISIQAIYELGASYGSFKEGKWPETIANLLLACIRLFGAKAHFSRARRDNFGKKMTQEDAIRLLEKAEEMRAKNPGKPIDFEKLLEQENFSNTLQNIDYSLETRLSQMLFSHIQFKKCNFSQAEIDQSSFNSCRFTKPKFEGSQIVNSSFSNCQFSTAVWIDATIRSSIFSNCSMNDAVFFHNAFDRVEFENTKLNRSCFNDSSLKSVRWNHSSLKESVFMDATADQCAMENCDLTNAALCGIENATQFHGENICIKDKPVIALTWDFLNKRMRFTQIICDKLRQNGAMVLKYQSRPQETNDELLSQEVREGLANAQQNGIEEARSLGEALLLHALPDGEISKIYERAADISQLADAVLLPGGFDIEPELYGKEREPETYTEESYAKSLLEMGILHHADRAEQQVMGICRGSQMINVFYGGTLRQHVDNQHSVIQALQPTTLDLPELEDVRSQLFGSSQLYALSMHHQCADKLGDGLHILFETEDGIPKAWIHENGRVLGMQCHPEVYDQMEQYGAYLDDVLDQKEEWKTKEPKKFDIIRQVASGLRGSSSYFHKLFQRLA